MQNVYFDMVGCRLNQAEIEALSREFLSRGYSVVKVPSQADLIIVNTCCVTLKAGADSRKMIRHYLSGTKARVIATGCWATLFNKEALQTLPEIALVPNSHKDQIPLQFADLRSTERSKETLRPDLGSRNRTRAFIKVQDGCDNNCAYCATTLARGRSRSIPVESIIKQINKLSDEGVKEVILSGVQLGSWGKDIGYRIGELVSQILAATRIPRIRLSSIEPWDVDETLIQNWSDGRMLPHLHIPLQSGSAEIMRLMRRPGNPDTYRSMLHMIRTRVPEMAISTDIIIGFPGETETHFEENLQFVQNSHFSRAHIFSFSPMPYTEAARLPDQVQPSIIKERWKRMNSVTARSQMAYDRSQLGRTVKVLFESDRAGFSRGLSPDYQPVKVKTDRSLHNQIHSVLLVQNDEKAGFIGVLAEDQTP